MRFCEKCNYITENSECPVCGGKLRAVEPDDFCYFTDLDSIYCVMFDEALKNNGIQSALVPFYPHGVTHSNAGRASNNHIYVRYKDFDSAQEIYDIVFGKSDPD